jgi:hypothetical protein
MAVLHYGNAEIELTADEVRSLTASDSPIYEPGLISLNLTNGGWIHLVVGPGIPIWIDDRAGAEPQAYVT